MIRLPKHLITSKIVYFKTYCQLLQANELCRPMDSNRPFSIISMNIFVKTALFIMISTEFSDCLFTAIIYG